MSFEKKFGDIESIEEAENKLSEYLLQNIEIEQIEQVETKKHQRTKNNKNDKNQPIIKRKSLLGKRKHIDIDDNNDENEEKQTNLKKVHKSENTEKKQVFLDTK